MQRVRPYGPAGGTAPAALSGARVNSSRRKDGAIARDHTHEPGPLEIDDVEVVVDLEEELDELLEDWRRVGLEAAAQLRAALPDRRHEAPPPSVDPAGAGLRHAVEAGDPAVAWLVAGAGLDAGLELVPGVPLQPVDLLWQLAAASIEPDELTGLPPHDEATLRTVEADDWIAPLVGILRDGPGARAGAETLARHLADDAAVTDEDLELLEMAFGYRLPAWQAAGIVDADQRLTEAGAWILPRAACTAWGSDFDHPDLEDEAERFDDDTWADGASGDPDGADPLVDDWTRRFDAWLRNADLEGDVDWVESLLSLRVAYLDDTVTRWDRDGLTTLFLEVAPGHLSQPGDEIHGALPALATFLRFLDAEDLLHPDSDPVDELAAWLDHAGPAAAAAMDDRSRWGPSKALFAAMQDDGIEITDQAAVQDWITAFNARPQQEREQVLGGFGPAAGRPPLVLPPDEDLAVAVTDTKLWRQVTGLVTYVGDRLPLTDAGNLKLADARKLVDELETGDVVDPQWYGRTQRTQSSTQLRGLQRTVDLAVATGLLQHDPALRPVPDAIASAQEDPLSWWEAGVLAWLRAGIVATNYADRGVPAWVEDLDAGVVPLLVALTEAAEPVEIDRMTAMLSEDLGVADEQDAIAVDWLREDVHTFASNLEVAGLVEVTGVRLRREPSGRHRHQRGRIAITDLGRLLLTRTAAARAHHIGSLRDESAGDLLDAIAELPIEVAESEVAAWLTGRPTDAACAEVVAAVVGANRERSMLAFLVLDAIGTEAETAVRGLADDPVAGPFARAWLVQQGLAAIDLPEGDDVDAILGILNTVAVRDGPDGLVDVFSELGDTDDQLAFLDAAWRSSSDEAAGVLEVVGSLHADKTIRKAARKAAFKRRSAT